MGFIKKGSTLVDKIKEVDYVITGNYVDESKNILEELRLEEKKTIKNQPWR